MALERTYTIPLRREFQKAPKYKRAKKAVTAVREFMQKHMKSKNILIGPKLNLKIWERGIKNPPHHIKVVAIKDEKDDIVRVELFGFKFDKKEKKEAKKKATGIAGKIQQKLEAGKKDEEEPKEMKSDKKEMKKAEKLAAQVEDKNKEVKEPKPEQAKIKKEEKPKEDKKPTEPNQKAQ